MTTKEWLINNGFELKDTPEGFETGFSPVNNTIVLISVFEEHFYPSIKKADENNQSSYDAVMKGNEMGWDIYFDDWKEQGILN